MKESDMENEKTALYVAFSTQKRGRIPAGGKITSAWRMNSLPGWERRSTRCAQFARKGDSHG